MICMNVKKEQEMKQIEKLTLNLGEEYISVLCAVLSALVLKLLPKKFQEAYEKRGRGGHRETLNTYC